MTNKTPDYYISKSGVPLHHITDGEQFNIASAIKYCFRAGKKSKETEIADLQKAIRSIELQIDFINKTKEWSDDN